MDTENNYFHRCKTRLSHLCHHEEAPLVTDPPVLPWVRKDLFTRTASLLFHPTVSNIHRIITLEDIIMKRISNPAELKDVEWQ